MTEKTDFTKQLDCYQARRRTFRVADVLDRMHRQFIPEQGLRLTGKHHEVYLSDARKVAPDKLRTILRQPVTRAGGQSSV